ncbi:hypothetical protein [Streptococcus ovuberis]|nr:hypothetical protein [Streptococcus ovuberis]
MEVTTKACTINGKTYKEFSGKLAQLKENESNSNDGVVFYKLEKR